MMAAAIFEESETTKAAAAQSMSASGPKRTFVGMTHQLITRQSPGARAGDVRGKDGGIRLLTRKTHGNLQRFRLFGRHRITTSMLARRTCSIALLGVLLAAAIGEASAKGCSIKALDRCRDVSELSWDKSFPTAVRRFLGNRRADYNGPGLLSDQALAFLWVPGERQRIGDLWRFTGCQKYFCPDKGAVVFRPTGEVVAVALLTGTTLSIFIHPSNISARVADNLSAWAKAETVGPLGKTEIIDP
jgi:hypothetical protein